MEIPKDKDRSCWHPVHRRFHRAGLRSLRQHIDPLQPKSVAEQNRDKFANHGSSWRRPMYYERLYHESQCGRAFYPWLAGSIRCPVSSHGRSAGQRPYKGTDQNMWKNEPGSYRDTGQRTAEIGALEENPELERIRCCLCSWQVSSRKVLVPPGGVSLIEENFKSITLKFACFFIISFC